ncbi:hypothetical protein [Bacillus mycoides]|uniref:hypothetical protein n=1 Tax=Bacillus mycoides TaxID=1405 RepID=UPI0011AAA736|nr:hypothetical protein [Bacillus mycoides]
MEKGQQVVICSLCGGNKVKSPALAFKNMLAISAFTCLTIIGIPLGIILFIVAFKMKYSKTKLNFTCVECKHEFKVKPDTYDKFIKAIS